MLILVCSDHRKTPSIMATKNTMSDRNLVSKGTSSDDTPTPGFVLKELVSKFQWFTR